MCAPVFVFPGKLTDCPPRHGMTSVRPVNQFSQSKQQRLREERPEYIARLTKTLIFNPAPNYIAR